MKKLFVFIYLLAASTGLYAQEDCMSFCAKVKGTVMINRSYDAHDNLLHFTACFEEPAVDIQTANLPDERCEEISTPAGTFNATKRVVFFKATRNDKMEKCKRVEWYAVNAGIVRSETYDEKGKLEGYTVLTKIYRNNTR